MEDKRKFRRVNVRFDVTLSRKKETDVVGTLRDVAVQGIFVTCESSLPMGAPLDFRIVLHGGIDDVEVLGRGEVVRVEPTGVGVHIKALDIDSVQHLRNIIAFNADDPEEAIEEMQGDHTLRATAKGESA